MKKSFKYIVLVAMALLFAHCVDTNDNDAGFYNDDILSISKFVMANERTFSKFEMILEAANLKDALDSYNPEGNNFTLFLPTNDAIDKFIDKSTKYTSLNDLLADTAFLTAFARYHVVLQEFKTNDFPFGALPTVNATGDYLTIGLEFGFDTATNETLYDSTVYKVNNVAKITQQNIFLINGIVHVISDVLEPIVLTSLEWLKKEEGFSIITEAFELTGLSDTMGVTRFNADGVLVNNVFTLLIEPDSVFHKYNVYSVEDLIDYIVDDPTRNNYTDPTNPFYQFVAYHILERRFFLESIEEVAVNYNTYGSYPVNIRSGIDVEINRGSRVYDIQINGNDTVEIKYIKVFFASSNVKSTNGAIHFVNHILELYKPRASMQTYQFIDEEPNIRKLRNEVGEHIFFSDVDFTALKWEGIDYIQYVKGSGANEKAVLKDYIRANGDFTLTYKLPKVLAGTYSVILRANSQNFQNATVQVFIDGKRVGSSTDLTTGGNPYKNFTLGKVTFQTTRTHVVEVKTLIPGLFEWDFLRFDPNF